MTLKGVCSVEVRNADGSLAHKTTDENMVTNYINNLINPNYDFAKGFLGLNIMSYDLALFELVSKTIGGVMLFGENLPEDPDYRIAKAKLVGHASSEYAIEDPTYGVFNKEESNYITDNSNNKKGFKYVWDFATNRANGTIRCISLTTGKGGTKGYSYFPNETSTLALTCNGFCITPCLESLSKYCDLYPLNVFDTGKKAYLFSDSNEIDSGHPLHFGINNFHRISFSSNSKIYFFANMEKGVLLFVSKTSSDSITFLKCKIKRNIGLCQNIQTVSDRVEIIEEKTITFNTPIFEKNDGNALKVIRSQLYTDESYIYASYAKNSDLFLYKIDPLSLIILENNVIHTDIEGVGYYKNSSKYALSCAFYKGYYYAQRIWDSKDGSSKPVYVDEIKIDPKTLEYTTVATLSTEYTHAVPYSTGYSIYDDTLFAQYDFSSSVMITEDGCVQKFKEGMPMESTDLVFPYHLMRTNLANSGNLEFGYGVYTQGLITIDNLSTPIIKNSTQTMKITYEITETE